MLTFTNRDDKQAALHLQISIPSNYPLSRLNPLQDTHLPPDISFTTADLPHSFDNRTLESGLHSLHNTFRYPSVVDRSTACSPLNLDIANLLRDGDTVGWESIVRYWTGKKGGRTWEFGMSGDREVRQT